MYNNLPSGNPSNPSAVAFNNAYSKPLELDTNTLNLMKGFFEGRGFSKDSAESIAVTFIRQAKTDGYNPLQVLDTLKGMKVLELHTVVTEVLNYNRYKTSYLGKNLNLTAFEPVSRNIIV